MKYKEPLNGYKISKKNKKHYFSSANKKQQEIFEILKQKALKGEMRSKHCACLVRNGKPIHLECNHYGSDTGYSDHAETALHKKIQKSSNKIKKNHIYDLYVIRYSHINGFMNSKPCSGCINSIRNHMDYVNKVIYSWDSKTYIKEHKSELKTEHVSRWK